jgi:hypothetical protein
MPRKTSSICVGLALISAIVMAPPVVAATSFSNSLTGFSGASNQPATQTAVAAAGFNFASLAATERVQFSASGASFGPAGPGDNGRNYMRTNDSDYATVSFVAEITTVVPNFDVPPYQSPWLGVGAGNINLDFFSWPDVFTLNSSVGVVAEKFGDPPNVSQFYTTFVNDNENASFFNNSDPALTAGLVNGTHRMRLSSFNELAVFSIDFNYAGGAFVEDYRAPVINTRALFGTDGWPTEPSRIYFGGDDGAVFKDFSVATNGSQGIFGDLNGDGNINGLDWVVLRSNLETDLSPGLSLKAAYLEGDLTLDKSVDYDDFKAFQVVFEQVNGAGSFADMLAGVPEPSTTVLFLFAGLIILPTLRRASRG